MARRRQSSTPVVDAQAVIDHYRDRLVQPAALIEREWEPVVLGPTWRIGDDGRFVLPEHSIGWEALAWSYFTYRHSDGRPWVYTDEQARFLLWWYAVDETGRFLYSDGVLQRLKGWGKDPLGACICGIELLGPCRFAEWGADGQPLATDSPEAWVQTAAVALEQTRNTMRLFPSLFTQEATRRYRLQIGREVIHALRDERTMQAVTSSPKTLEGNRPTFVLANETQHWISSNAGHEMSEVIARNAAKSADGAARSLRITNAYEPGEDSVAERDREAWEAMQAGRFVSIGLLYDSIEAPPEAPLTAEAAPGVVRSIRGDSVWLAEQRVVEQILDPRNPPSRSRRFWYNQIVATEDAWLTPQEIDNLADPDIIPPANALVTLGFDGSKSDDHCALIGSLVDDDHLFEIGVWFPDKETNEVDRADIDRVVRAAFESYDVVGFYSDLAEWESYVDRWAEDLGEGLVVKAIPRHPIAWDIRGRAQAFTHAAERLHDAIVESARERVAAAAEGREPVQRLTYCGSKRFRQHLVNTRRAPNRFGISVRKEHRESQRKIDSTPAATLARLARFDYLALPEARRRKAAESGMAW